MMPSSLMHKKLPKNTSVFFQYDMLRTFYFVDDAHIREPYRDTANEFKSEEYQNAGQWIDKFNLSAAVFVNPNLVPVCIGGVFATCMHRIQKQPRQIWEAIERVCHGEIMFRKVILRRGFGLLFSHSLR
jgi:hypothetical protein